MMMIAVCFLIISDGLERLTDKDMRSTGTL